MGIYEICKKCDERLKYYWKFCPVCGTPISDSETGDKKSTPEQNQDECKKPTT